VRVVEIGPCGFGFVTLDGHLEAGRIRFTATDLGRGRLEVCIEAWARGGDRISNLLFDRVPVNKEVQRHMWTSVLERLRKPPAPGATGRSTSRRAASTRPSSPMLDERLAATPRARRALDELAGRPLNIEQAELAAASRETGWHIDDDRQPLPAGHFERGQMEFTVRKWLDDGTVESCIHVVSQRADIGNPIVRLGFRLVGRRAQVRFARRACGRMATLVAPETSGAGGGLAARR
jgi:hypothetical protein